MFICYLSEYVDGTVHDTSIWGVFQVTKTKKIVFWLNKCKGISRKPD